MAEQIYEELEKFLTPYVIDRFNQKSAKQVVSVLKRTAHKQVIDFITWLTRAFVRCITNVSEDIYLKDIVAVIIAEANLAIDSPPFRLLISYNFFDTFESIDFRIMLESEVHRWLVYLQENQKLPGVYERFTGRFIKK